MVILPAGLSMWCTVCINKPSLHYPDSVLLRGHWATPTYNSCPSVTLQTRIPHNTESIATDLSAQTPCRLAHSMPPMKGASEGRQHRATCTDPMLLLHLRNFSSLWQHSYNPCIRGQSSCSNLKSYNWIWREPQISSVSHPKVLKASLASEAMQTLLSSMNTEMNGTQMLITAVPLN